MAAKADGGGGRSATTRPSGSRGARTAAPRLGRDDWLDAAHDAVADGGFDAVRVLPLAARLGVTRGSFYWHFVDHAELVAALIERWRAREVAADRALQADVTPDARADLVRLLDAALARRGDDLREMRYELALRDRGRHDPAVAALLAEVDALRTAVLEEKYRRLTGDRARSARLAVLLYVAIVGASQALGRPSVGARAAALIRGTIVEHLIDDQRPARPVVS